MACDRMCVDESQYAEEDAYRCGGTGFYSVYRSTYDIDSLSYFFLFRDDQHTCMMRMLIFEVSRGPREVAESQILGDL